MKQQLGSATHGVMVDVDASSASALGDQHLVDYGLAQIGSLFQQVNQTQGVGEKGAKYFGVNFREMDTGTIVLVVILSIILMVVLVCLCCCCCGCCLIAGLGLEKKEAEERAKREKEKEEADKEGEGDMEKGEMDKKEM